MTKTPNLSTIAADFAEIIDRPTTHAERMAWRTAARYYAAKADFIRRRLAYVPTDDPEPYADAEAMAADIRRGYVRISTAFCDHETWTPAENMNFRLVHDVIGHCTTVARPYPFTVQGETLAWQAQRADLLRDYRAGLIDQVEWLAIGAVSFTEAIGSLAYAAVTGDFVEGGQPIGFLPQVHGHPYGTPATVVDDRRA